MKETNKILAAFLIILLAGCMSIKKATKKVLADPAAKEIVGREWEKSNPCTADTITQTLSDTLINTDTVILPGSTVTINDTVYKFLPGKVITRTVTIRDTFHSYVVDTRRLKLAYDSMRYYYGVMVQRQGQIDELKGEVKHANQSRNKAWLYFWVLLAIAAGSHYLRSKLKLFS